jgi:hypothetical protein
MARTVAAWVNLVMVNLAMKETRPPPRQLRASETQETASPVRTAPDAHAAPSSSITLRHDSCRLIRALLLRDRLSTAKKMAGSGAIGAALFQAAKQTTMAAVIPKQQAGKRRRLLLPKRKIGSPLRQCFASRLLRRLTS